MNGLDLFEGFKSLKAVFIHCYRDIIILNKVASSCNFLPSPWLSAFP